MFKNWFKQNPYEKPERNFELSFTDDDLIRGLQFLINAYYIDAYDVKVIEKFIGWLSGQYGCQCHINKYRCSIHFGGTVTEGHHNIPITPFPFRKEELKEKMLQPKFTDNEHMELIAREVDICYVLSRLPVYIYTKKSNWLIFKNETWELVDFWPSLREIDPNKNPPRILKFRLNKNV